MTSATSAGTGICRRMRGWRKLAWAAWGPPSDPQFYGDLDIDAAPMLAFRARTPASEGAQVTVTHLVGRAVAHALHEVPGLRVSISHHRERPCPTTDVFFIVSDPGSEELTGIKVERADEKSAVQVARELRAATAGIRSGDDEAFGRVKRTLDRLPSWAVRPAIRVGSWVASDLELDLPALGIHRRPFGSAMVSSVGMWGVTRAYSPLAAYYRVPVLVLVGAVSPRPVAVEGRVVVRPMVTLTATFDHRYVDGRQAVEFARAVRAYCAAPERFEPAGASVSRISGHHGGQGIQTDHGSREEVAMHAAVGDRLVIRSAHVGQPERDGEIIEVRHEDGSPPYVVRWSDSGHESLVYPGPDAEVQHAQHA
jgi:pyruvate dehydrogenase E2 component (dihydrolipoamide acetyltransferase)